METRTTEIADLLLDFFPLAYHKFKSDVMRSDDGLLTSSHFQLLLLLKNRGSLSNSEIAEHLQMARPNISTLLAKLIETGYVLKEMDVNDRRYASFRLSNEGVLFLKDQRLKKKEIIRERAQSLTEEEQLRLSASLQELIRLMEKI
ncbi:MAG: MarR family winged helix-turn-helix transcriptional regulator [Bacilli bacterium]